MSRLKIEYEIEEPEGVDYTHDELREWIEFETGVGCQMSTDNPLIDNPPEAVFGSLMIYK